MSSEANVARELIGEIATLMSEFSKELERRAAEIEVAAKDPDLGGKLMKGADAMRDSGNIYLSWARHFADISEGKAEAADEGDESEDFSV
jgi:hypothetical protein